MWFFSRDPLKDFAYELGARVSEYEGRSIWTLHEGTKKANGERVSIFAFESRAENEHQLVLAKGAFKRLKTLRHPNYIVFLDGLETDKSCYIVTEAIVPLSSHVLLELQPCEQLLQKHAISWGLHQIAKALSFLNKDCSLSHNNINIWSVFVDVAGEWKVGGLEYALPHTPPSDAPIPNTIPHKGLSYLDKYDPPEKNSGRKSEKWTTDMWGLGCLIWELFNGEFHKNTALKEPEKIPKELIAVYCQLVGANPRSRPTPTSFLQTCCRKGGYMNNDFVECMQFIEEIQIKDSESKASFFGSLASKCDSFPVSACKCKLLPRLREALEFGDSSSCILNPLFKLGKLLSTEEFQKSMVGVVVKLFSSPDRATRVKLLQQMEIFGEHLPAAVVNQQIFPSIATGFLDSNPVVREQTIKSMLYVASKLDYKNLNEELMKHFARLQSKDTQGGIRTNTTICLGKIACYLHPQVRQKVLVSAFTRAFKDPFPAARQAAVMGFAATHRFFTMQESAQRILPSICSLATDTDKSVRDQVFKTIKCFLARLELLSEDPEKLEELEKDVMVGGAGSGDVAGWAGWAVSGVTSLTSKLYKNKGAKMTPVKEGKTTTTTTTNTEVKVIPKKTEEEEEEEEEEKKEEGGGWDDEDWGDLTLSDTDNGKKPKKATNESSGWDVEDEEEDDDDDDDADWGSLEAGGGANNNQSAKDIHSVPVMDMKAASTYDWKGGVDDDGDFFSSIDNKQKTSKPDDFFGDWSNDNKKTTSQKLGERTTTATTTTKATTATKASTATRAGTKKQPMKLHSKSQPEPDFFSEGW